jgi:DNA-binding protein HU-beta
MSKSDLVNHMADKAGISKASAADALDALVAIAGGSMRVPGLGTFTKRHRAARTGRNPRTGEPIQIAASYSVGFKAAKNLKDAAGR